MSTRRRTGFTLVELLVVLVIISMLVALLVPAVMSSRNRARITQCMNSQKELATAIIAYDTAKGHLPGYRNTVGGNTVGWVPVLLPFLGRNDLWEGGGAAGWRGGAGPSVRINQLVCPGDSTGLGVSSPLTYVVSAGVYGGPTGGSYVSAPPSSTLPLSGSDNNMDIPGLLLRPNASASPPSPGGLGIFRDYAASPPDQKISLSDVKSPSQTVMLSEKPFVRAAPAAARQWTDTNAFFSWPNYPPLPAPVEQPDPSYISSDGPLPNMTVAEPFLAGSTKYWPPLASQSIAPGVQAQSPHAGVVVVTFCDGHTDTIPAETPCSTYRAVP
jgi:prepilin-type N-terminal cleavage/methylation domain-containing protein